MKRVMGLFILMIGLFVVTVKAAEVEPYFTDAFYMNYCYTEESVLANDYEVAEIVNVGDKIICNLGFETNASDEVESLKYTLIYGSGLKLVDEETDGLVEKVENTYFHELDDPTSVGEDIGNFTFEVVSSKDISYGMSGIEFVTTDGATYSSSDQLSSLKYVWDDESVSFPAYDTDAVHMNYCYTEESVLANQYKVAETVGIGDKIICILGFETNATDKVKSLQYTLVYGGGLKLVSELTDGLDNKSGNTYSHILDDVTSVGEDIGIFTFEVVGSEGLEYGFKDVKFITEAGSKYTSGNASKTLKSNFTNPKTGDANTITFIVGLVVLLGMTLVLAKVMKTKKFMKI